jgi:glycosyltransferase involved in cell wall biosynthesis
LLQEGVPAKLVIIGDGPERDELQRQVSRSGLEKAIMFAGYRNNAKKFLPLFDVFVLPSNTEGTPIVLLEAMAAAVPIVATAVGGVPELLEYGNAGILVDPGIPEGIANAFLTLYKCPELRNRLSKRAFRRVSEKYSMQSCAQNYQQVYENIVFNHQRAQ